MHHYDAWCKWPVLFSVLKTVLTRKLAGIRHFRLPRFASSFHEAGYNVLLYDNRNWGDSDGTPRQESNPALQQTDYYDAFNYVAEKLCVDSKRIVYWGTSFSGGNVIYAAAVDKRVKAAIVQAPAVSGETRSLAFADQIPSVLEDRARIASGQPAHRVPVVASSREAAKAKSEKVMFPDLHAYEQLEDQFNCGGKWENYVTSQTQLHMLEFESQAMIHRVSPTPLLMVVPGNDVLVSTSSQLAAFGKAREPKKLVYLEDAGHFDIYVGDAFERNIKAQLEFLRDHLTI